LFARPRLRGALAALVVLLALSCMVLAVPNVFGQNFPTPSTNPGDFVVGPGTSDQTSDQFSGSLDQFSTDQFSTDQFSTGQFTTGRPGESTMQDLNISPEQLDQFKNQYQSGSLSEDQFQELCARIAAKHLSDQDVQALANSMGFAADQAQKLRLCAQEAA